jgi:GDP-mannose transporter
VVSGANFSMNFLLLFMQSTVCVTCVILVKKMGVISFRDFDKRDAKIWFPISFLLVSVIYTGSKSLVSSPSFFPLEGFFRCPRQQFLSIPVYTIFKNLTIILIVSMSIQLASRILLIIWQAYGEAIWFGGKVTTLTLVSFIFMASPIISLGDGARDVNRVS